MCLSAIHISSLVKCLIKSFAHFFFQTIPTVGCWKFFMQILYQMYEAIKWDTLLNPELRKWRQEDQEFKVTGLHREFEANLG